MKGALIIIAAMLGISAVGFMFTRFGKVPKIILCCLAGLGILALLWLAFLFSLEGMGGD